MGDPEQSVVIAGGGPVGMMLAAELALAGVDVAVLERRPDAVLAGSRAGGFHARTIEILDQRGVADRFLAAGQTAQVATFGTTTLDMSDFPSRHPYTLGLWQNEIERLLGEWLVERGVVIRYGCDVTGFAQDEGGVDVRLADGDSVRADYLVACDGGRSSIRKAAGIDFPGWDATRSTLIAEAEVTDDFPAGVHFDAAGAHGLNHLENGEAVRIVTSEREISPAGDATLGELRAALVDAFGSDFGVHSPTWISRFTDATRQAAAYRDRRVLLAGDAAHIHYPAGGQGLSLGLQDAVNLGWKLAQVAKGVSAPGLLDTYFAERHPVAARSLRLTMALGEMQRRDDRMAAVVEITSEVAALDEARKHLAGLWSGLDVHYDLGGGHPLLGRRMPDLDLGSSRVYEHLYEARPLLLNFGEPVGVEGVPVVDATHAGPWELPVIGNVPAPSAVLIRPDGYVAWVGEGTTAGLDEALRTWFGAARTMRP